MWISLFVAFAVIISAFHVHGHGHGHHNHNHEDSLHHTSFGHSYKAVHHNQTVTVDASIFKDKAKLVKSRSRCGAVHPEKDEMSRIESHMHRSLAARGMSMDTISMQDAALQLPIPVYWHRILPDDGSEGHVPKKMIKKSIKKMNKAFKGDVFELVGVTTTRNSEWYYMTTGSSEEDEAKSALRQGGSNALNIYSCRPDYEEYGSFYPLLGIATFPWWYEYWPSLDGVMIQFDTVPNGGNTYGYDEGDTLTHEVGHWLGLYHVFQDNTCDYDGDEVPGTSIQSTATYGCPASKDSCPAQRGEDNIHNFMDYSDDICLNKFNKGQLKRMAAAYYIYRQNDV